MARLDTELLVLLSEKAHFDANPSLGSHRVADDEPISLSIVFTGDLAAIEAAGFRTNKVVGQTATGSADIKALRAMADLPNIVRIQGPRKYSINLSSSVPEIKANLIWTQTGSDFIGYTGEGVIVGIIDSGIDFNHHTFKKPDGTTRIRKIWDQTLTALVGETVPGTINNPNVSASAVPLGYGVEYTTGEINPYLQHLADPTHVPAPAVSIRHQDVLGHGTHVAGIAAGNGNQSGDCFGAFHYIGVAPDADIVMVRLAGLTPGDPTIPIGHDGFTDAMDYIVNEAKQGTPLPLVINSSLGSFSSTMDGTDSSSAHADTLLNQNTGLGIIFSAGNWGNGRFHARVTIAANPAVTRLPFTLANDDHTARTIAVTYLGINIQVQLTSPGGVVIPWLSTTQSNTNNTMNGTGSTVTVINNANHIGITITPPNNGANVPGSWLLELRNAGATPTQVDGFCVGSDPNDGTTHRFDDASQCTSLSTLSENGSGIESISVGNYELHTIASNILNADSGRGPTIEATPRHKPDICAPGEDIKSAGLSADRSCPCCCQCCQWYYVSKSGTSMAAPHIAGVVALMLHKNPNLSHTDIKTNLTAHAASPTSGASPDDLQGWGAGKADAQATVNILPQVNPPKTAPAVAALAGTTAAAREQFLATENGPVLSRLFHRYSQELLQLVNHNKRVATAWHRVKGPIWTRLAMQAFYNPALQIQKEIDGVSLQEAVARFLTTLKEYASQAFLKDLQPFEPMLANIPEAITLSDMIHLVGNFKHPSFTWQQQPAH